MKSIPYTGVRRSISQYVQLAKRLNHVTMNTEIRAARLQAFCQESGIGYTPVLLKLIGELAGRHPRLNAVLSRRVLRQRIFLPEDVDVSIAVEKTWRGETFVTTPLVRQVNRKSLAGIAVEIKDLVRQPFENRPDFGALRLFNLLPDFLKAIVLRCICGNPHLFKQFFGTVGFTNLGKFGVVDIVPVPAWLNTMIFAVGSIQDRPVVRDGAVTIEPVMHLTMSFNHSVMDGGAAARILADLRQTIESGVFPQ